MTEHDPKDKTPEPKADDQSNAPKPAGANQQEKEPKPQRGGSEERNVGG